MPDLEQAVTAARADLDAAFAELEVKRQAHVEANAAGWVAHNAWQAQKAVVDAAQTRLGEAQDALTQARLVERQDAETAAE